MFNRFFEMLKRDRMLMLLVIIFFLEGPVMELFTGGITGLISWFVDTLVVLPGILIGLSFHEFAHAKVAVMCGDNTPEYYGRVTLDPRAHIDPMGLISLIFLNFGWGKPVVVNPMNFRNRRMGGILVGLAGVTMNLCIAVVTSLIIRVIMNASPMFLFRGVGSALLQVLIDIVYINIYLMLFNLLPIPPLDGYGVVGDLFNVRNRTWYMNIYYNSRYIMMLMLIMRLPSRLLSVPCSRLVGLMFRVAGLY